MIGVEVEKGFETGRAKYSVWIGIRGEAGEFAAASPSSRSPATPHSWNPVPPVRTPPPYNQPGVPKLLGT